MKKRIHHNVFESENVQIVEDTLSHAEQEEMVDQFMTGDGTSFNDVCLEHGITNIEQLFPDYKTVGGREEIDNPSAWCDVVVNGVSHVPFEKTRTEHFDITGEEARARGYIKGNEKLEEQIAIMKRTTEATMVYKLQSLDKDDEIEMDFDLLSYYRKEMREKLKQENARAILFGDGRPALIGDNPNPDKISEDKIKPIWTDVEFYSIHRPVTGVTTLSTTAQKASAFVDEITRAMADYEGSGNPTLFVDGKLIQECLLLKDNNGRRIYKTLEELKSAMGVSKIVDTYPMKGGKLVRDNKHVLAGIIVNLNDYVVGTNAKGQTKFYDDFDLKHNKTYLLVENRFSGMLKKYHSAICIEIEVGDNDVVPLFTVKPIAGTETKYGKLVSALQEGVRVTDKGIVGKSKWVTGYSAAFPDNPNGNFLALHCDCLDDATTTVELVGGKNGPATFTSDDKDVVFQIDDNKKQFIRFVSTVSNNTITQDFNLMGLILENPPRA